MWKFCCVYKPTKEMLLLRDMCQLFEELSDGSNVMIKYNEWEGISKTTNKLHKGLDLIAVILLDESPNLFKNRK